MARVQLPPESVLRKELKTGVGETEVDGAVLFPFQVMLPVPVTTMKYWVFAARFTGVEGVSVGLSSQYAPTFVPLPRTESDVPGLPDTLENRETS